MSHAPQTFANKRLSVTLCRCLKALLCRGSRREQHPSPAVQMSYGAITVTYDVLQEQLWKEQAKKIQPFNVEQTGV